MDCCGCYSGKKNGFKNFDDVFKRRVANDSFVGVEVNKVN
jgi:hypothetical protein